MSTGAGSILLFLLIAVVVPAATLGLARAAWRAQPRARAAGAEARMLPAWVPVDLGAFLTVLQFVAVDVAALAAVIWLRALGVLDKGYSVAVILLFLTVVVAGAACVWRRTGAG